MIATLLPVLIPIGLTVFGCWVMTRGGRRKSSEADPATTSSVDGSSMLTAVALTLANSETSCLSDTTPSSDCSPP